MSPSRDHANADPTRLHSLLASRWSPTRFDEARDVMPAQVELLLEAARWAPSAGNSQPWAFVVGRRGEQTYDRLSRYLTGSSAGWAGSAGVLVANLAHRFVEDTDWEYSEFATYDLGQAVAHMTVQARAMNLYVRQFRAFDRAGISAEFGVPDHWEVTTMSAIGFLPAGQAADVVTAEDGIVRHRRPVDDLRWAEPMSGQAAAP